MSSAAVARRDRVELACLGALLALACAPLAGLLLRVWTRGGVVTGGDGFLVTDPLQYLDWLRQAGRHVAVANLYDLGPSPHDFVHPGVLVSGLLHRLGLGLVASYDAWKPVAVVVLFVAVRRYAHRFLAGAAERRTAIALALFACSPISALVGWGGIGGDHTKFDFDFVGGELWPGTWLWGYLFTALAVAVLPLGLLAYERGRAGGRRTGLAGAAVAGAVASWLQPWQGATFAVILVAAEAVALRSLPAGGSGAAPEGPGAGGLGPGGAGAEGSRGVGSSGSGGRGERSGRAARAIRDLLPVLGATALPLVYYWALAQSDPAWGLASRANAFPRWPWYVTVLGLAPLGLPALLAYRRPAPDFGALALRTWPLAALAIFYQPAGTFPFHAFQGIGLPLAVLAVQGAKPLRLPAVAIALALIVLIVPGTAYRVDQLRAAVSAGRQPFFLTAGERDGLRWLERQPGPGGVLAPVYSGLLIPAYTGRATWIGAGSWTPDFRRRERETEDLFGGRLDGAAAAALVRRSAASFVFSDCHGRADIRSALAAVAYPSRRFGCATAWRVR
jgi:hypothetical protein